MRVSERAQPLHDETCVQCDTQACRTARFWGTEGDSRSDLIEGPRVKSKSGCEERVHCARRIAELQKEQQLLLRCERRRGCDCDTTHTADQYPLRVKTVKLQPNPSSPGQRREGPLASKSYKTHSHTKVCTMNIEVILCHRCLLKTNAQARAGTTATCNASERCNASPMTVLRSTCNQSLHIHKSVR